MGIHGYIMVYGYKGNIYIYTTTLYPSYLPNKGISIHVFSLWFYVLFCVRWYRIFIHAFFLWIHVSFGVRIDRYFYVLLLSSPFFSIWLSLFQYEYNQNIYSFIYPTYLLWFCFVVDVRWYRYIYLPPWTYPLFGARVYHMVQISHRSPIKQNTHFV